MIKPAVFVCAGFDLNMEVVDRPTDFVVPIMFYCWFVVFLFCRFLIVNFSASI